LKILLIAPPIFDFYTSPHRLEPLGLLYIKKALSNSGHSVEIYDATASGKVKKIKTPPEFEYLDKYYCQDSSPFSLHSGYKRFGDSFNKILDHCQKNSFDIIGISSLFSAYHPDVELLASEIKKVTDAPVIIGGTAVNSLDKEALGKSAADYMISGCGSVSMPIFAEALSGKAGLPDVPGLIYMVDGKIIKNPPSRMAAWSGNLIPERENLRIFKKQKSAPVVFSSGCRNKCSFCSIHLENSFNVRELSSIKEELLYLHSIGVENVDIEDDDLFSDRPFAQELLDLLKHFHSKGMTFTAMNGTTAKNIIPFADKIVDSGFIKLDLSLVCFSELTASGMGRPHNIKEIETIVSIIDRRIEVEVFIIPGLPGTSLKETLSTMIYLNKMNIKCGLSPLYLVPGVPMFEKTGIPQNLRLCRGSALYPFSEEERNNIASLLKISRFLNYKLSEEDRPEYSENLFYFRKSLSEKKWLKKTKDGKWENSFSFSLDTEII
jgi:anaerobic magnesium-protoporphyrin IX monomethyl ester cyclase